MAEDLSSITRQIFQAATDVFGAADAQKDPKAVGVTDTPGRVSQVNRQAAAAANVTSDSALVISQVNAQQNMVEDNYTIAQAKIAQSRADFISNTMQSLEAQNQKLEDYVRHVQDTISTDVTTLKDYEQDTPDLVKNPLKYFYRRMQQRGVKKRINEDLTDVLHVNSAMENNRRYAAQEIVDFEQRTTLAAGAAATVVAAESMKGLESARNLAAGAATAAEAKYTGAERQQTIDPRAALELFGIGASEDAVLRYYKWKANNGKPFQDSPELTKLALAKMDADKHSGIYDSEINNAIRFRGFEQSGMIPTIEQFVATGMSQMSTRDSTAFIASTDDKHTQYALESARNSEINRRYMQLSAEFVAQKGKELEAKGAGKAVLAASGALELSAAEKQQLYKQAAEEVDSQPLGKTTQDYMYSRASSFNSGLRLDGSNYTLTNVDMLIPTLQQKGASEKFMQFLSSDKAKNAILDPGVQRGDNALTGRMYNLISAAKSSGLSESEAIEGVAALNSAFQEQYFFGTDPVSGHFAKLGIQAPKLRIVAPAAQGRGFLDRALLSAQAGDTKGIGELESLTWDVTSPIDLKNMILRLDADRKTRSKVQSAFEQGYDMNYSYPQRGK